MFIPFSALKRCALLGGAALTIAPAAPLAQTATSARLEGLGPDFVGIVDDAVSDAAFNPARLGALAGTQVYVGRLARRYEIIDFPSWGNSYRPVLLPEGFDSGVRFMTSDFPVSSVDPVAVTLFVPVGDGMEASFSLDVGSYGSDRFDETSSVERTSYRVDDGFRAYKDGSGYRSEFTEVVFDAAVSTSRAPGARALGARVTVKYAGLETSRSRTRTETFWPWDDVTEQMLSVAFEDKTEAYEHFGADATVGWYRPGRAFREATLTAGALRITRDHSSVGQNIFDEDHDGNGTQPDGGTPAYQFWLSEHVSERDYTGGGAGGRVVIEYGERLRSVHTAFFQALAGDGDVTGVADDVDRDLGVEDRTLQSLAYAYDGTIERFGATSAVGYTETVGERLTISSVVRARYARDEFDEGGDGEGALTISSQSESASFSSPYGQDISLVEEVQQVRAAAAAEWTLPPYLAFRMGVAHDASRVVVEATSRRDVAGLEDVLPSEVPGSVNNRNVSYATDTSFRAGLSAKVADRLFVDMYAGALSFSAFSYATLRFEF